MVHIRLASAAMLLLTIVATPAEAHAQIDLTAGVLVVPNGVAGTEVGPALSVRASTDRLGAPLFAEVGAGRTDFRSLGQDYHDDHLLLAVGFEWVPTQGDTSLGLELAVGAYRESQTVETNPPTSGGDNWNEMILPGVTLTHELWEDRRLVVSISDALIGNPYSALVDSDEYGIEHRLRLMVGLRF